MSTRLRWDILSSVQRLTRAEQQWEEITEEEIRKALNGTKNFSAPGPDGINNFWWKKFTSVHRRLARVFNGWLSEGLNIPQWFVEGKTILIPKKGDFVTRKTTDPLHA